MFIYLSMVQPPPDIAEPKVHYEQPPPDLAEPRVHYIIMYNFLQI